MSRQLFFTMNILCKTKNGLWPEHGATGPLRQEMKDRRLAYQALMSKTELLTHVEVDLDNQQLTFIKNGTVIVNTNIVTGMVGSHRTPIGLYEAHNKQTNCTLTGADYEVFVKYWVSVIGDSIGLHDASWRSVFGGDQYIFNGSHGCINIPEAAMVKIFNNIEDGTPVLIFGQNKWYQPGSADSPATKNPLRGTTAGK